MTPLRSLPALQRLRRRLALGWLVLALVLAPALGRMHQVVHAPGLPAFDGHAHGQEHGASALADALHALFAGHAHADCQVLDQQTLAGPWLAQALPLAQAAPQGLPVGACPAQPPARPPSPFHARAPPLAA